MDYKAMVAQAMALAFVTNAPMCPVVTVACSIRSAKAGC
jgi:hypothetical protein